jgi:hypothetical protein
MEILLGDLSTKEGRKDIFKPTVWNGSLHENSNDNGIRTVNCVTSKNLVVKNIMFLHRKLFINMPGLLLIEKHTIRLITS